MIHAMKPHSIHRNCNAGLKKPQKPTNLTLSQDAREKAAKLMVAMFRPSISNVVETLIHEKAALVLPAENNTPAPAACGKT